MLCEAARRTVGRVSADRNPQAAQMADESMVRNLRAQIQCIWPMEQAVIERHDLPVGARVLDVGCGTGEFAGRLLAHRPDVTLLGVDLEEAHLTIARARLEGTGRAEFRRDDAFGLDLPDGQFDLVACRHVIQSVPDVPDLLAELVRVTKPGGVIHLVAEDYGLMTFHPTRLDSDEFWYRGAIPYATATGSDLRIGRKTPWLLAQAGCVQVRNDVLVLDTLSVGREAFADVWRAWRDGYTDVLVEHSHLSREEVVAHWADMIECIESGYACWLLPVVSGRAPSAELG